MRLSRSRLGGRQVECGENRRLVLRISVRARHGVSVDERQTDVRLQGSERLSAVRRAAQDRLLGVQHPEQNVRIALRFQSDHLSNEKGGCETRTSR